MKIRQFYNILDKLEINIEYTHFLKVLIGYDYKIITSYSKVSFNMLLFIH